MGTQIISMYHIHQFAKYHLFSLYQIHWYSQSHPLVWLHLNVKFTLDDKCVTFVLFPNIVTDIDSEETSPSNSSTPSHWPLLLAALVVTLYMD